MSLPWMHLLRALLDGMEGEWPTYSGVRDACVVCSEPPETMWQEGPFWGVREGPEPTCLLTEDGPVHLRHEVMRGSCFDPPMPRGRLLDDLSAYGRSYWLDTARQVIAGLEDDGFTNEPKPREEES